jgi:hypothetical protein
MFDPENHEEARAAALAIRCPRCGSGPGMACQSSRGQILPGLNDRPGIHPERRSAAIGGPVRENREHPGRRQYLQSHADPTLRVSHPDGDSDPPASAAQ